MLSMPEERAFPKEKTMTNHFVPLEREDGSFNW